MKNNNLINNQITMIENNIKNKIYNIRNTQVMLDRDLAEFYGVETKRINEQVKRNIERFDDDFMFQLTKEEFENWKSQNEISNSMKMSLRKLPFAFTEQGVYMLATVLKSKNAVYTTKQIMRTFTNMKKFLLNNASIFQRFEIVEQRLTVHDKKLNKVFEVIENKNINPVQGIFCDGQIFDAYIFINDLLKSTKKEIILIDNYIDDTVLTLFSKYQNIQFIIVTKSISKQLKLDIYKYNQQYNNLTIKKSNKFHDRFLLIDDNEAYHMGVSLKDLGKKVFAFNQIDKELVKI